MIRLIAAVDVRLGVATAEGIPWHLPGDAAYFRAETANGVIVMGGATYVEFAEPLHGGENYVLTTRPGVLRDGFRPIAHLDDAVRDHPDEDVWVIGGAGVFARTIGRAGELLITRVLADFDCTKFFPPFEDEFTGLERGENHEEGGVQYRFERWGRRRSGP
jgi:dihydrofolate reductase